MAVRPGFGSTTAGGESPQTDAEHSVDRAPLHDRDLLQRMSHSLDAIDDWLCNAGAGSASTPKTVARAASSRVIGDRRWEGKPSISGAMLPWRDVVLSAHVTEVGLPGLAPGIGSDQLARQQFELPTRVTVQTRPRVVSADLLMPVGMQPAHRQEGTMLDPRRGSGSTGAAPTST